MALTEKLTAIADAIREKTGKTEAMTLEEMPTEIAGITGGGGGSSEDVRYVTFMSYDGTVEYGKKAVAVGDDCADPIARGVFSTPTRESDAQYTYTFAGWATAANGGLNANWNKSVTEDRTVYANFASVVRYYTVTYYDGETVLKTEQVAYGLVPSYFEPEKEGYQFDGWDRELEIVVGDTRYTAQWSTKLTFANATWEQINEICEAGQSADYFAINDTKDLASADGTQIYTARIIGLNVDDKHDGSGNKAGITVALTKKGGDPVSDEMPIYDSYSGEEYLYDQFKRLETYTYKYRSELKSSLDPNVTQYMKWIKKQDALYYIPAGASTKTAELHNSYYYLFMPSYQELTGGKVDENNPNTGNIIQYEGFAKSSDRQVGSSMYNNYWIRDLFKYHIPYYYSPGSGFGFSSGTADAYVYICFCI